MPTIEKYEYKNSIEKFVGTFVETFVIDLDKPSNLDIFRHREAFNTSIPNKYMKTDRNLILSFLNGQRIYICLKWNLDDYINRIVPKHLQEQIRELIIVQKKDN